MSWLCDHRACISLGWIVSADAGCAGSRRILVERAVWYQILTTGIISEWCVWCRQTSPCLLGVFQDVIGVCPSNCCLYFFIKSWKTSAVYLFLIKIEKRQLWVRPIGGWNSTLQAALYVRHAHWACLCYVPIEIWCLWITSTIWLLILSSTSFMVGRSRVFYIYSSWKI